MPDAASDRPELEALLPAVYAELRRLAPHYLRGERPGQTLQPTALVHEAGVLQARRKIGRSAGRTARTSARSPRTRCGRC